jgi:hypothetical protein
MCLRARDLLGVWRHHLETVGASYYAGVKALDTIGYARDALSYATVRLHVVVVNKQGKEPHSMSRLGRMLRSRIALALLGVALVGGGGAYWAMTSSAPPSRQAASSLTNADSTSAASAEDPTATSEPDATMTATTTHHTLKLVILSKMTPISLAREQPWG